MFFVCSCIQTKAHQFKKKKEIEMMNLKKESMWRVSDTYSVADIIRREIRL